MTLRQSSGVLDMAQDYFRYVVEMERNGFYCDIPAMLETEREQTVKARCSTEQIQKFAPEGFNPASPKQLLDFLRSEGINVKATSADILEENKDKHPIIESILSLRKTQKVLGTNVQGYRKHLDKDSLIHSSYGVEATDTGRLSSTSPNTQNVPPECRHWFKSRYKDGKIISTDLATLEYRLAAFESRCRRLGKLFRDGADIHIDSAKRAFGFKDGMEKADRKKGKTLNYAGVYGCGKKKFYTMIEEEDEKLFWKVKNLFPDVNRWKDNLTKQLHRTKRIVSASGRIRVFDETISNAIEREAFNWRLQSLGHDVLQVYLMEVIDKLRKEKVPALLVQEGHDSFLLDVEKDAVDDALAVVEGVGSNLNPLIKSVLGIDIDVPMYADFEVVEHWGLA